MSALGNEQVRGCLCRVVTMDYIRNPVWSVVSRICHICAKHAMSYGLEPSTGIWAIRRIWLGPEAYSSRRNAIWLLKRWFYVQC